VRRRRQELQEDRRDGRFFRQGVDAKLATFQQPRFHLGTSQR
jgi:hypothetical protein